MKNLCTCIACLCITLCSLSVSGQETPSQVIPLNEPDLNKPTLFATLPNSIDVNIGMLAQLLNNQVGSTVNITVSSAFRFQGEVVSVADKYNGSLRSTVVRSTNYNGARLSFSMITNPQDGTVSYTGRIISMQHGDLYELQNQNGQYRFVKRGFYEVVNE